MASLWRAAATSSSSSSSSRGGEGVGGGVEFWSNPERTGWLNKQGEYIKTWRRRWFVLKQGKLFWFKEGHVTPSSVPRGVIPVASCLTVKGAEDVLNRPFAFELSTNQDTMFFIADSEKEKEDWINSIGRSIVQHSRSVTDSEVIDYNSTPATATATATATVVAPTGPTKVEEEDDHKEEEEKEEEGDDDAHRRSTPLA